MKLNKKDSTITFDIMELIFYSILLIYIISLIDVIDKIIYPNQEYNIYLSLIALVFAIIFSYLLMIGYGSGKLISKLKFKE